MGSNLAGHLKKIIRKSDSGSIFINSAYRSVRVSTRLHVEKETYDINMFHAIPKIGPVFHIDDHVRFKMIATEFNVDFRRIHVEKHETLEVSHAPEKHLPRPTERDKG